MKKLGKGGWNQTYTARYDTQDGQFDGVFKPLKKPDPDWKPIENTWTAREIGIN
jgi:hypothetical protein